MRFTLLIHFMLQLVVSRDIQCSTVRHRRSHFASSDTNFFEIRLLVLSYSEPFEFRIASQPSIFLRFLVSYLVLVAD